VAVNERRFTIVIAGDASGAQRAIGDIDTTTGKLRSSLGKAAAAVGGVYAAKKAFDFLSGSLSDAAAEAQEMEVLAKTMRNNVGATDKQIAGTEKFITSLQNATGVMDDELRPAFGKLLIGGRTVEQSQKDLALALDIAAARGLSVEAVTTAMSKAAQGNVGALGRLGIATKGASGETLSYDQILQEAARTMGGSAAAAADTAAGRAAILKAQYADLKENIGTALIPIMEGLTAVLGKVVGWFNTLSPEMQKAILIIGGLSAALAFLYLNPVVAVIAGIAALAAGLIWAYQNVGWFHDAVDAVARFIMDKLVPAFQAVYGFIAERIIPVVVDLIGWWWKIVETVGGVYIGIVEKFTEIVTFIAGLPSKVAEAGKNIWNGITDGVEAAVRWVLQKLDTLLGPLDEVVGKVASLFGGSAEDAVRRRIVEAGGSVPRRAAGGPVLAGSPYIVGERGPELFVPGASGSIVPNGVGGMTVNVYMPPGSDGDDVVDKIREYERRNGTSWRN
jgi:hypothetical protein